MILDMWLTDLTTVYELNVIAKRKKQIQKGTCPMPRQTYSRKYGVSTTLTFTLVERAGENLETGATFAAGDLKIMKDEGAEGNTSNLPTDEGTGYSLVLTATEMQAARIVIYIIDQTGPKVWVDDYLIVDSYGNASAEHAFDLDTALQGASIGSIDGTAQRGPDLAEIAQYLFANTATLTAILADDSVFGKFLAKAAVTNYNRTSDSHESLGEGSPSPAAITDAVWDSLAADHQASGSAGRTLSRSPDLIWDEIMETNAALGRRLQREWMRLMAAAILGATAGAGDWSALSIGDPKTRISATLDDSGNRTAVSVLDGS
jgi:hypothetical protein